MQESYITIDEVVKDLEPLFAPRYVRERITKRSDFPTTHRIGSKRFWLRSDYERWIETRKQK